MQLQAGAAHLIIQVVVQVVAQEQVQQGLLAVLIMLQGCGAVESKQLAAATHQRLSAHIPSPGGYSKE